MTWGIAALIIAVFVVVVMFIFLRRLFEGLIKLFAYAIIIFLAIAIAYGIFVYKDINDLKQNFAGSPKTVVLMDNGKALTGLKIRDEPIYLSQGQLEGVSSSIAERNYKAVLGNDYKLIIIDMKAIANLKGVNLGKEVMPADRTVNMLRSGDEKEKAQLFEAILENNVLTSNPLFFFSQLKEGNIAVYQETALFKAAKILPLKAMESVARNIFEKTKETAQSFVTG